MQNSRGRPNDSPLWHFVCQHNYDPKSSIFKEDESRPDRHILQEQAQGIFGAGAIGGAGTGSDGGGNSGISGTRHSSTDRLGTGSIISTSVKFKSFLKCQQRQREQHQQKQSQNYQRQQKRRQQIDEYQQEQPRQQQQQQNCRYHHLHPMGNEEIENSMNHRTFNVQQQDKADGTSSISSTIDENDADCRKIIIGHDAADDGDDDGDHDHHGDENEDNYVCNRFSESVSFKKYFSFYAGDFFDFSSVGCL
ncbi:unnamed protein product [Trichobilharzia regenti]|nr:unnamed protein product [Trichobilharzia regenti]